MTSPEVAVIGTIEDHDGRRVQVGRDYGLVTIGPYRLTLDQLAEMLALVDRAGDAIAATGGEG